MRGLSRRFIFRISLVRHSEFGAEILLHQYRKWATGGYFPRLSILRKVLDSLTKAGAGSSSAGPFRRNVYGYGYYG